METRQRPKKLYQYQPYNVRTISNLIIRNIYLGSPAHFNDPSECRFNIVPPAEENEHTLARCREIITKLGICCLSEHHPKSADSFLMWSHYADRHRGFCIEFDTSKKPFSSAWEMGYEDDYPSIDFSPLMNNDELSDEETRKSLKTKSKHWEREAEWRIIAQEEGFEEYNATQLTAIYFGVRMEDYEFNAVARLLCSNDIKPALFRMRIHPKSYGLEADELEYTG